MTADAPPPDGGAPARMSQPPVAPTTLRGRRIALGVVFLLTGAAVALVASPLWVGIMLGTVMAFSTQPFFRWLALRTRRRRLSAALTTALGAVLLSAVSALALYVVVDELVAVSRAAEVDFSGAWPGKLLSRVSQTFGLEEAAVTSRLEGMLGAAASAIAEGAGSVLKGIGEALLSFVIAVWTMYYVLVNWPHLAARLERLLPLDPRHTRALILEFRDVGRSAFVGTVATAFVQGALAWVGYALAGVPHALAFGVLTGLASFLPLLGTAFVFVPVSVYELLQGEPGRGVFLLAWGLTVVVGFADYVVRPRLVGSRNATDPLLMLVALLGGLEVFGVSGLIVGPMIMSLFIAIARIYEQEVATVPGAKDPLEDYQKL